MLCLWANGVGKRTNPADFLGQRLDLLALRGLDKSRGGQPATVWTAGCVQFVQSIAKEQSHEQFLGESS
jgi:hypothetical protein